MCGICGIIAYDNEDLVTPNEIESIKKRIQHRGPDDDGLFIEDNVGLGHNRLSIIDLSSAGHQPMYSNDNRYVIVFNGEIYNYLELKEELRESYEFKTKCDTEIILASFIKWGYSCLDHFNGEWAFVIYDRNKRKIFGARDRYGIKPFYYMVECNRFYFASEIKALANIKKEKTPNEKILYEYLAFNRTDQTEETFYCDIYKLKHGHYFIISDGMLSIKQWYDLPSSVEKRNSKFEYYNEFREAIKMRLRSDVPIGVCLSGGLDSSSIVGVLLKEFGIRDINTFSAVYGNEENADEKKYIDLFCDIAPNRKFVYPTALSFYDEYSQFIDAQGEPVASIGPYAQYKVMELASKYVKVTIDGQGADEQLAGYHYFFGAYFKELLIKAKILRLASELSKYIYNHKSILAFKYAVYYLAPDLFKELFAKQVNPTINKDFNEKYVYESKMQKNLYSPNSLKESLLQHFEYKLEHLLKWEDHNAMHFSIESRVPFLDHNLVEHTLSLKSDDIIRGGNTKHILRESMVGVIPDAIRKRKDKKGFSTPSDKWFCEKAFVDLINETLNSEFYKKYQFIDVEKAKLVYGQHLRRDKNYTKEIWKWINLKMWYEANFRS